MEMALENLSKQELLELIKSNLKLFPIKKKQFINKRKQF
jgi:hypothetical protein